MKRVMTIQDISCMGKCSITVALPIISAMGIETAIVPTAVLSTHTGFKNYTFRDLTDDLDSIKSHWSSEGFSFDAIYTGYLGSDRQINIVKDYIKTFKTESTQVIVDPAMADGGKLYAGFDTFFVDKMKSLCEEADVILPNISEAALLTGSPYPGENASEKELKELLLKLSSLGAKLSVITGVSLASESCSDSEGNEFGFIGYNKETNEFIKYGTRKIDYRSHGTGDIFASTFTGARTLGFSEFDALKIASDYTTSCIEATSLNPENHPYGVGFEEKIPYLLRLVNSSCNWV